MARVIKRYENRKLYDTEDKRYVCLEEVASLIRAGHNITVIDNATESDITSQTLTKIISEEGSKHLPRLQTDSLHELVRWGGRAVTGGAEQLLRGLDRVLEVSLERMDFGRDSRKEMDRLRQRLEELEAVVTKLSMEASHEHNDNGADVSSQSGLHAND
jgi:polyhydroxyalkanoate synthesis repressor PhaR